MVGGRVYGVCDALQFAPKALCRSIALIKHLLECSRIFTAKDNGSNLFHNIPAPKIHGEIWNNIGADEANITVLILPNQFMSTNQDLFNGPSHPGNMIGGGGSWPFGGPLG